MKKNEWIDISVTIKAGMVHWPSDPAVSIKRINDMNKGDNNNLSFISMGTHTGTHMDAPIHFIAKGKSIDKMPLDACIGPARVIEIKDRESIKPDELSAYRIRRGERILFKTRNSKYWRIDAFMKNFVHIFPEAAKYLAAKGVRAVGVDYLSVGGYQKDGALTHRNLLNAGIWIIEGLDLSGVKPGKHELICLPLKILNSDGAPARAIIRKS